MKKEALLCCFPLCLILVIVTAVRDPNDIEDLKNIADLKENTTFGKTFPRHGLMLLFWLASYIEIDQNQNIHVNSIPGRGDYGCHVYKNFAPRTFPVLNSNTARYYSLGNLNNGSKFPNYVKQDYNNSPRRLANKRNMDRIVMKLLRNQPNRVKDVYITQHYENKNQGSSYNPDNTFRVDVSLLKQIKDLSTPDTCNVMHPWLKNSCDYLKFQQEVTNLKEFYPDEPGLAQFMALAGYNPGSRKPPSCFNWKTNSSGFHNNRPSRSVVTKSKCDAHNNIKLEVQSTSNGYTRISWSGIPENILRMDSSVGLYNDEQSLKIYPLNGRTYGSIDTDWALNPGLQVKLTNHDGVIWTGPEFDDANGILPTNIRGYDASLQLYTKGGYACARLFIKKSFNNWQSVFKNSWVGFHGSALDESKTYQKYQWVTKFKKNSDQDYSEEYDIFEYQSSTAIGPGVQLRFLFDKGYTNERARTEPWEDVISPKTEEIHDELRKK